MLKLIENLNKEKNSNLFFIIEKKSDINKLENFKIPENILKHLKEKFEKKEEINWKKEKNIKINNDKSFFEKYFIWEKNIKNLFVAFFDEKNSNKNKEEFFWENFRKTPEKIILFTEKNILEFWEIALLAKYKFDYYLEEKNNLELKILKNFSEKEEKKIFEKEKKEKEELIKNIFASRDLVSLSTPEKTPEKIIKLIKSYKLKNTKIKILDHKKIKKLGLNLLENVWKASENKPALVILERIVDKKAPYYGFVWKWVVFDSGWLNVKVGDYMKWMKRDMWWASHVIHTLKELDDKKDLKVNIIWAISLAENAISENAFRPDDIIKAYNWKTVEIVNTDAEWRLVLADAMSYISDKYKLDTIITTATLTWSCMAALGYNYAWVMGNNEKIINNILNNKSYEKYCRLPFDNYLIEKTKGKISDLKNLSSDVLAWASMWAAFLSHFCDKWENFVHIDIAWVSDRKDDYWVFPAWATGFWVKSMSEIFLSL